MNYTSYLTQDGTAVHILKCVEPFFTEVAEFKKQFEMRKEDRVFKYYPDDTLVLCQFKDGIETGKNVQRKVSYVLRDAEQYGLMNGYVIMSIR